MKVAIHQPQYMPWLGYFDKIDQADVFVLLDDVQYKKNEWQNRNRIRNAEGESWLTVPVFHEFGQKINDVKIDNHHRWKEKHIKSIEMNYSKSPYFDAYISFFHESFEKEWEYLADLNIHFIKFFTAVFGITSDIVNSSALKIETASTERLIDICRELEADTYLAGAGGSDYMDLDLFEKSGIRLECQNYVHPEYKQVYNGFCSHLSALDLLFCQGEDSLRIIREGRK